MRADGALFWKNVEPEPNSGCWLWIGSLDTHGYGQYSGQLAHRISFELLRGPLPKGEEPDHLCRVRRCINPWHVESVTHRENVLRGRAGRLREPRTHCPRGHPYTDDNVVFLRPAERYGPMCRICRRSSSLASYHRNRGEVPA